MSSDLKDSLVGFVEEYAARKIKSMKFKQDNVILSNNIDSFMRQEEKRLKQRIGIYSLLGFKLSSFDSNSVYLLSTPFNNDFYFENSPNAPLYRLYPDGSTSLVTDRNKRSHNIAKTSDEPSFIDDICW